ncbi:hypothetical protein TNCV_4124951 [Trichonephila clavipes]|nr:hypothetical protein TNCV_4124951 [Trichonephila clavipes]
MIQDYNPSSRRLSFRPRFSRHRSPFSLRLDPSPLPLPSPPPNIVCLVRPVARDFGNAVTLRESLDQWGGTDKESAEELGSALADFKKPPQPRFHQRETTRKLTH